MLAAMAAAAAPSVLQPTTAAVRVADMPRRPASSRRAASHATAAAVAGRVGTARHLRRPVETGVRPVRGWIGPPLRETEVVAAQCGPLAPREPTRPTTSVEGKAVAAAEAPRQTW